jgi:hypothetical protein
MLLFLLRLRIAFFLSDYLTPADIAFWIDPSFVHVVLCVLLFVINHLMDSDLGLYSALG